MPLVLEKLATPVYLYCDSLDTCDFQKDKPLRCDRHGAQAAGSSWLGGSIPPCRQTTSTAVRRF